MAPLSLSSPPGKDYLILACRLLSVIVPGCLIHAGGSLFLTHEAHDAPQPFAYT